MSKQSEILADAFPEDDPMNGRFPNTNTTSPTHKMYNEEGKEIVHVECVQKGAIQRIFGLWKDLFKQIKDDKETVEKQRLADQRAWEARDRRIKEAYDNNTEELRGLRQDLENRKLINNYNKEEKERLERMLSDSGKKSENTEVDIYTKVENHNKRISFIEGRINLITWFMGGTTGAIIFYVAYIILKDFMNF